MSATKKEGNRSEFSNVSLINAVKLTSQLSMQQYTKPLYHILRRLNLPRSTLQTFELKTGLGKIEGKKLFYRIAANESEIVLKIFRIFVFIL